MKKKTSSMKWRVEWTMEALATPPGETEGTPGDRPGSDRCHRRRRRRQGRGTHHASEVKKLMRSRVTNEHDASMVA
jgi:hypothetical protein